MMMWNFLLKFSQGIDGLNRFFGRAMIWPVLAAVLFSAGNALSRKFFDLSSNAFLEVQWYFFSLAFLGSAGYVLLVDEHVRIDALAQNLSKRARCWVDIFAFTLFILPLTLIMGKLGFDFFWQAFQSGEMSYNSGGLIRWPAYACIPLGMALLGLQVLSEIVRRVCWLAGHSEKPNLSEADLPAFLPDDVEQVVASDKVGAK